MARRVPERSSVSVMLPRVAAFPAGVGLGAAFCIVLLATAMRAGRGTQTAASIESVPEVHPPISTGAPGGDTRGDLEPDPPREGNTAAPRAGPHDTPMTGELAALWRDPEGKELARELLLTSSLETRRVLLAALEKYATELEGEAIMEESERFVLVADLIALYFETTDPGLMEDVRGAVLLLEGEEIAGELQLDTLEDRNRRPSNPN